MMNRTRSTNRKHKRAVLRKARRASFETLEDRRLLATIPVNVPDLRFEPATGRDTYVFSDNWDGAHIVEHASLGDERDTLDFSNVGEDLYFRVLARNRIEVVADSSGYFASAQHVEMVIPGSGNNSFTVEKGARWVDGAILGNSSLLGQSILLSYTSDADDPNKLFASGFSKPVAVDLAAGTANSAGVEFTIQGGQIEFVGGLGADHVVGIPALDNTLRGGKGSDTLIGSDQIDWMRGDNGNDILRGGGGNDRRSGSGVERAGLLGGAGDDDVFGDAGEDVLSGDKGGDLLVGGSGDDVLYGGDGNDRLTGDHDVFDSTQAIVTGNDELIGGAGDDLYAFGDRWGNDTITEESNTGYDTLDLSRVTTDLHFQLGGATDFYSVTTTAADSSTHTILASNHIEQLLTGNSDGSASRSHTFAVQSNLGSNLQVDGWFNRTLKVDNRLGTTQIPLATLDLSEVVEPLWIWVTSNRSGAKHNRVTVTFGSGKKLEITNVANIIGSKQLDTLTIENGGSLVGNLDGHTGGVAIVYAESVRTDQQGVLSGADQTRLSQLATTYPEILDSGKTGVRFTLAATAGDFPAVAAVVTNVDSVSGGGVRDVLFASNATALDQIGDRLRGGNDRDGLFGKAGRDHLTGGSGGDLLSGGDGDDTLHGDSGDDILLGDAGDDIIYGGTGIDGIVGGAGDDTLHGGPGSDTFVFEPNWERDTIIADRVESRNDTLDFTAIVQDLTYSFVAGEIRVGTGPFARDDASNWLTYPKASGVFTDVDADAVIVTEPGFGFNNKIATIEAGSGKQTFLFGNDWRDTTLNTAAASEVVLDFSAATVPLAFEFQEEDGNVVLTVTRGARLLSGLLTDAIPGPLDDYAFDKISSNSSITIPITNANTTVISGRNDNTYKAVENVSFPGTLKLTGGRHYGKLPGASETSVPNGLFVGHKLDVTEVGGFLSATRVNLVTQKVNGMVPTGTALSNVFAGGGPDNNFIANSDSQNVGDSTESRTQGKFNSIAYGPGLNLLQGTFGPNTFTQQSYLPGVHVLSGLTGGDTYEFKNNWGLAFVAEFPDWISGTTPVPEALDTLDFSDMVGDLLIDVYQFDTVAEAASFSQSEFTPAEHFQNFLLGLATDPGVGTNVVIARDVSATAGLAGLIGDGFSAHTRSALESFGTSYLAAMEIESIEGPAFGNMTVRFHGNASLRGTVSAGELGTVTLDYSSYDQPVTIESSRYAVSSYLPDQTPGFLKTIVDSAQSFILDGELVPGVTLPGLKRASSVYASASNIGGHRLGGLTTFADMFGADNVVNQVVSQLGVTGLSEVIGSPQADTFIDTEQNITFGVGQDDELNGNLNLRKTGFGDPFVVDVHSGTVTKNGVNFLGASTLQNVESGLGDDLIIDSASDNRYTFRVDVDGIGWGVDTLIKGENGGGRDTIELILPEGWQYDLITEEVDSIAYNTLVVDNEQGVRQDSKLRVRTDTALDLQLVSDVDGPAWPRSSPIPLTSGIPATAPSVGSTSRLTAAVTPGRLSAVPSQLVNAALNAFDGLMVQVPRNDGGPNDLFTLSVSSPDGGDSWQLLTDAGSVLLDTSMLNVVLIDLPDDQLSWRRDSGDILIDRTAADFGWHASQNETVPSGKVDLTSALIYELAVRLQIDPANSVMQTTLDPGVSRRDLGATPVELVPNSVNAEPLRASQLPSTTLTDMTVVNTLVNMAVQTYNDLLDAKDADNNYLYSAAGNPTERLIIASQVVEIGHLPEGEVIRTLSDGTIRIDATAAGNGWYTGIDPPTDTGELDLLHALMHEIGRSIGMASGEFPGQLMNETLASGVRHDPPETQTVITAGSSDQSKLQFGLEAFADWVNGAGASPGMVGRFVEMLSPRIEIPLLGDFSIASLLKIDEAVDGFASTVQTGLATNIVDAVAGLFAAGSITTDDIAALDHVAYAPSSNDVAFTARVPLPGLTYTTTRAFDFDDLEFAGFDPADFGFDVSTADPPQLNVTASVDFEFMFGIDPAGQFYVDSPSLVASIAIDSGRDGSGEIDPFDLALNLGPFGVEVDQGVVDIRGSMSLGLDGRLTYADLLSNQVPVDTLLPSLGSGTYYIIDLPLNLAGALSGLNDEGLAIRSSGTFGEGIGSLEAMIGSIELDVRGLSDVLDLRGVGLDDIINGIIAGLDALVETDGDNPSLIARKIPGLNQSALELFGNGTEDFVVGLRNRIAAFRDDSGTHLGNLQDHLNAAVNDFFDGDPVDPFTITYEDSNLLVDFDFERVLVEKQFAFQVDLNALFADQVQEFVNNSPLLEGIDLGALDVRIGNQAGNVAFDVTGSAGVQFGFGFDLSDVTDPVVYVTDSSQIFAYASAALGKGTDVDVAIDLADLIGNPDANLPTVKFAIRDAVGVIDVRAAYGLESNAEGRYAIGDISADDLAILIDGQVQLSLPLYYGENIPVGGTTADRDGNGLGDNVLHIGVGIQDASLRGGDFSYDLSGPGIDGLFSLGALLNDPQNMLDGLEKMFEALDSDIAGKFHSLGLPLVGDRLQQAAGFVADLRDEILGHPDPVTGVYSDGKIGQRLQSAIANDETVVEVIKAELYRLIGGGSAGLRNLLRVPDLGPSGDLQYDASGRLLLKPIESLDDIGVTIRGDSLTFNLVIADTLFSEEIPLSFDASMPGLGLNADTGLDLELGYVFGLGFGVSGSELFYVDTSGVTDSGSEFSLDLSATLKEYTAIDATLGFLKVEIEDAVSGGRPSGLFGNFSIDLRVNSETERWSPILDFGGLTIEASLTAEADVDLLTTTMFDVDSNGLELPTITSTLRYDQLFARVVLSPGAVSTEFGESPLVVFHDVQLDLGGFITGFAKPVVDQVAAITDPIKPVIEVLTKEIGILKDLGAKNVSLLSIAGAIMGPTRFEPVQRGIQAIADIIDLVDTIDEFTNAPGSLMIDLGSFTVLGGQADTELTPSSDQAADVEANVDATGDENAKKVVNKFGKTKGSFRFPLLSEPTNAFGLLLGKKVDLFLYEMPGLNLDFNYARSFPVFPGLNARLGGRVSADTDFTFGFDSSGLQAWADGNFSDPTKIFEGFFVDDQLTPDGRDLPEVSLSAAIAAGASVGIPGLVEAGVEGGIQANIGLNLNDVGLPGNPNGPGDGKLRFSELVQQLDQGPACLFDMRGELTAFLDAFFWVGLDTFLGKITVFEARQTFLSQVLADFDMSCPAFDATVARTNAGDPTQLDVSFVVDSGQNPYQGERYRIRQETSTEGISEIVVSSRGFTERFPASGIATINIVGSAGNDEYVIDDNVMANVMAHGQGGDDVIRMFSANETPAIGYSRTFYGGPGDDTLIGSDMVDVLRGDDGNDILVGGGGADDLDGGLGDDLIQGGDGDDLIQGGLGKDKISGDGGDDTIHGDVMGQEAGDRDFINGGDGDDTVYGQGGDDFITGAAGVDWLYGGDGDDTFSWTVGDGVDAIIDGGLGSNTVEMAAIEGEEQRINDTVTVSPGSIDPADIEVQFDSVGDGLSLSTTLVLHQVQVLNLKLSEGADSVTANDLAGTLLQGLDVDFGTGEILERVPITETRNASSTLIRDGNGAAIVFEPAAELAPDEVVESTFLRQRFEPAAAGQFEFEADGTPKLVALIDGVGNAVLDIGGAPILVQANSTGTPMTIDGQFVLDEYQTRSTVTFEDVPVVFMVSDPLESLMLPLGDSFQRFRYDGGQYQFNTDGSPRLIDDGGGLMVQENVGGTLQLDQNGEPILDTVQRRTIDRSKRTLVQQYDEAGNAIDGQFLIAITPQFGIDSFADTLRVIGTAGSDDFILRDDGEAFYANQVNGVEFVISSASAPNDRFVLETLAGDDTILADKVQTEFLRLEIDGGDGNDRIVGSPFGDLLESGLGDDTVTGGRGVDTFSNLGGSDTLLEQRDSNFYLTDTTLTVADLVAGDAGSPGPRNETIVEVETIAGLFDLIVLRGFAGSSDSIDQSFVASEGGEINASVNVFSVSNFSGDAILDGGWGGDYYRITLNDTTTTREQSLINIVDSDACFGTPNGQTCVIPSATFDDVQVFGTAQSDIFWLTGPNSVEDSATGGYIERLSPLSGTADDLQNAFAALGEFTADINTRNATGAIAGLFRQIVDYRSTESSSLSGLEGDDLFIVDDNAQPASVPAPGADPQPQMNLYGDAGADRFFIGSVISTKQFEGQTVVDEITAGVSYPTNFWGGPGNDYFEVNHNLAEIFLYGEGGDDTFFLQAHLTTIPDPSAPGSMMTASDSATMHVTSEEGQRDILSYVRNAPVNVIGGDGFDTLVILGTAQDDDFYIITEFQPQVDADPELGIPFRRARVVQKIYGAGLIVNDVTGIERIVLLTGAGDDNIYLYATLPNQEIQIITGSGDDTIYAGGGAINNIPIVVPERTETRVTYTPQPDIVTYERILVQPARTVRVITGYQLNLGFVKAFPIYANITIPAVYRTEERRTPQDPVITTTEVTIPERNELVTLPEVRNLGFVQSPIIIDGNAIENVSNDRIIFDHGNGDFVPLGGNPIRIGMVREEVEVVSIETNDSLLAIPAGADPQFYISHVRNELRDLHRIRRGGLIDDMLAQPGESTDIRLRPGRVLFRLNESPTGNLGLDFVNLGVVTNVNYDAANDLVVAGSDTTLAGPEGIDVDIEIDRDDAGAIREIRVVLAKTIAVTVPNAFVVSKTVDSTTEYDTTQVLRVVDPDFPIPENYGVYYTGVNRVDVLLSEGNDLFPIFDTAEDVVTRIEARGGDDQIYLAKFSGTIDIDLGAGNDNFDIGDQGVKPLEDIQGDLKLTAGTGNDSFWLWANGTSGDHATAISKDAITSDLFEGTISYDEGITTLFFIGSRGDDVIDVQFGRSQGDIPDAAENRRYFIAGGFGENAIDLVRANFLYATDHTGSDPLLQVFDAASHLTTFVESSLGRGNFMVHNGELRIGTTVEDSAVLLKTDENFPVEFTFDTGSGGFVGDGPVVFSTPEGAAPTTINLIGQELTASVRVGALTNESSQPLTLSDIKSPLTIHSMVENVSVILDDSGTTNRFTKLGRIADGVVTGLTASPINVSTNSGTLNFRGSDQVDYALTIDESTMPVWLQLGNGSDQVIVENAVAFSQVNLGAGNNHVHVLSSQQSLAVVGGAGNDRLVIDESQSSTPIVDGSIERWSPNLGNEFVWVKWGGDFDPQGPPTQPLPDRIFQLYLVDDLEVRSGLGDDVWNVKSFADPIQADFRMTLDGGGGEDLFFIDPTTQIISSITGGAGDDTVQLDIAGLPAAGHYDDLFLNVETLVIDNSASDTAATWTRRSDWTLIAQPVGNSDPTAIVEVIDTSGVDRLRLVGSSAEDSLVVDPPANVSAVTLYGPVFQIDAGLEVVSGATQQRYRDLGIYIRFDGLTEGATSYVEDGFLISTDTSFSVSSTENPSASTSGIVTLEATGGAAITLQAIQIQGVASSQTIEFTGTPVSGAPVVHTITVNANSGIQSYDLPVTFENLQRVTWQPIGTSAGQTMVFDDIVVSLTPLSVTGPLVTEVPATTSATTDFLIDTHTLSINGIGSGGQINGTTFTARSIEVSDEYPYYLAEFRFAGDLVFPPGSVVRATAYSDAISFVVANDVVIGEGTEFRFNGVGYESGPGGGDGGWGGRGGRGGALGLGGQGGDYSVGTSGSTSSSCGSVPTGNPTTCVINPGNPGMLGRLGGNGNDGDPGDDGMPGYEGEPGFNGGVGGVGASPGTGAPSPAGGQRSPTQPAGGIGSEDLLIRSGSDGFDGGDGANGSQGNDATSAGQPSVEEPSDPFAIVAGGGGGGGAGGGGGSAGGGGAGGTSGGSGAGGRSGYSFFTTSADNYSSLRGGRGGNGGAGGDGGRGGHGGWGGDGSTGGGGGGAFEIIAGGRVRVDSDAAATTLIDVSGGQADAANLNRNSELDFGLNTSRDSGFNQFHQPAEYSSSFFGQTASQGVDAGDGGAGGIGGHGGAGGLGGEGGFGTPGTGGGGGSAKLVGSVVHISAVAIMDAGGGDPESPDGRLILGANHAIGLPILADAGTLVRSFVGHANAAMIGSQNYYLPGNPITPNLPDLVGGAEAFGLLKHYTADDFAELADRSDEGPVAAVLRLATLDLDKDPTTTEDFPGYDVLLVANLSSIDLFYPTLGITLDAAPPTSLTPLLAGGIATDPTFGGTPGSGPFGSTVLSSLSSGQIWATLVPESEARISVDVGSGYAGISDVGIAVGETKFVTVNVDREEVIAPEAMVVSPDGNSIYVIDAQTKSLSVINAFDLSLRERLVQGTDGVTTLPSPSDIAVSPDGNHLYVINADADRLSVFTTEPIAATQSIAHAIDADATVSVSADGSAVFVGDSRVDSFARNPTGILNPVEDIVIREASSELHTSLDSELIYSNGPNGSFSVYRNEPPSQIVDVNVDVDMDHPSMGELTINLIAPWGSRYQLARRVGGTQDADFVRFDDEATRSISQYSGSGTYRPSWPLALLDNRDADGTWRLEIFDDIDNGIFGSQTLRLFDWTLRLQTSAGHVLSLTNPNDFVDGGFGRSTSSIESPLTVDIPFFRTQTYGGTAGNSDLAISSDDRFVYVISESGNSLRVYERNLNDNILTVVEQLSASDATPGLVGPRSITLTGDDRFVIIASKTENTIAVYSRDFATGKLTYVQLLHQQQLGSNLVNPSGMESIGSDAMIVSTANGLTRFDLNTVNPSIARTDGIEIESIESARVNVSPAYFSIDMLPDAPTGFGWNVNASDDAVELQLVKETWQNPNNPFDVEGNGAAEPYDVLLLINEINRNGAGRLPVRTAEHQHLPYYDVNGDGHLTPLDVLMVITHINLTNNPADGSGGEGESATGWAYGSQPPPPPTTSIIVDRPETFRGTDLVGPRRVSGAGTLVQPAFDLSQWLDAEREESDLERILDEPMADDEDVDAFFATLGSENHEENPQRWQM